MYIDDNNNADTNIGAILDPLWMVIFGIWTHDLCDTNWVNKPTRMNIFIYRLYFHHYFSCVHNCKDRFYIPSSTVVHMYDFHIFTVM